ncbi:hypothetical protein LLE49_24775 [Alicyclobacillus tolerans]|uniref:hypothetical protein n=1 Tax=Alicyclobacillus tolerans TaxID=90970 RepID=UPI001F2A8870|nr:hypothetical protein [Alicyclobacillus tolerans]MCF8567942.1 hypothetical protein [Alicyclobacillus tolerans]
MRPTIKSMIKKVLGTVIVTTSFPASAYAAPATIQAGVTVTEQLLGQAAQWLFGLIAAGAAIFFLRALWQMHSADDDSQYAKGRKHLIRSIWTFIVAGCVTAIIATLRTAYGF